MADRAYSLSSRPPTSFTKFLTFVRAAVANPRHVGAIAPSSSSLARIMTAQIAPSMAPVLELGAGTGVFTQALLSRGVAESDLILVERDPSLAQLLRQRFPQATVLCCNAAELVDVLREKTPAGAAISGLPLRNMDQAEVQLLLSQAFSCMRAGSPIFQFTYGLSSPVKSQVMQNLHLECRKMGSTWRNLPPATVYRLSQHLPEPAPANQR
jgi:phospholipid N-methyltransferase